MLCCGCARDIDYLGSVSEQRDNIYMYSDDGTQIKIYVGKRETPYSADGIKGEMSEFCEVFVYLPKNCDEVEITFAKISGLMNYRAVENCYYLACGKTVEGEKIDVEIKADGEVKNYTAASVLYDGVISCNDAVKCAIEHDGELFSSLTRDNAFFGEIFVRLLFDDGGCYYYVGVCDRNKTINAYLVDGERGQIIAKKQMNG